MSEALRLVMISHGYFPRVGGAERQLGAISPRLLALGVEVHILTRRHPGLLAEEVIDGVPVHRLAAPGPKALASLMFTDQCLHLIRRLRPQVIHAHELFSPATTAELANRLWGIPWVVTAHRSGPLGDVQRMQKKWFGAQRLSRFARDAAAFVVISREIDEELAGLGLPPEKRAWVPNGVDPNLFCPLPEAQKQALRAQLGFNLHGPLVVFSGRFAPEKRVNLLVQAWPAIRQRFPQAELALVGTGPEEAALRQAAGPGVIFAGQQAEVAPFYQAADLFVLPSAAEGLSVAMLEAMSSGLPALVTRVGGCAEVMTHGQNGWIIPPDDAPALEAALITLLGAPALRAQLGTQARVRVLEAFSIDRTVERLLEIYRRAAGGKG